MPHRYSLLFAAMLGLAACTGGGPPQSDSAPPSSDAQADRSGADTTTLVAFLRSQGGTLAAVDASTLAGVRTVRLNADYTVDDLALLATLPNLREVMIWRDGEGPAGTEGSPAPTDADLAALAKLTQLETLRIGGWSAPFTDTGVAHLSTMPALRRLDLIQAQHITDAAMVSVARLPALTTLDITYTKISDVGLTHLLASSSLKSVQYGWAGESKRWLAEFERDHPDPSFTIE